jgi:hypothetical protein
MPDNTQTEDKTPATEIQQDVAKAVAAKAEAASTAKAIDELSEDDLGSVAGGVRINFLDLVDSPIMGSLGYQPPKK